MGKPFGKLDEKTQHSSDIDLAGSSRWGVYFQTPVLFLALVLSEFFSQAPWTAMAALGISLLDTVGRVYLISNQHRYYPGRSRRWLGLFRALALLGSATWSVAVVTWLGLHGLSHPMTGAWLLNVGAIAAMGSILHRAHLPLAWGYNFILVIPAALRIGMMGGNGALPYVLLLTSGVFVLGIISWTQNQAFLKELQIRGRLIDEHRDRVRAQAAVAHASKMASLGAMTSEIAHEIKNPVAVIDAYAQTLAEMADSGVMDIAQVKESAERIHHVARRMDSIINGLRAFGQQDQQEPFRQVDLKELVTDTLTFCEWRFQRAGIVLRMPEKVPKMKLECRPAQMGQVLVNLLNNAFEAVSGKFEKPWVEVSVEVLGGKLVIRVADCGPGIPKEIENHLMQAFYTTKRSGQGLGLGLAITNQIVKSHQGELFVEHDRSFTTFTVKIPLVQTGVVQRAG